jgi:hypothetical protein
VQGSLDVDAAGQHLGEALTVLAQLRQIHDTSRSARSGQQMPVRAVTSNDPRLQSKAAVALTVDIMVKRSKSFNPRHMWQGDLP